MPSVRRSSIPATSPEERPRQYASRRRRVVAARVRARSDLRLMGISCMSRQPRRAARGKLRRPPLTFRARAALSGRPPREGIRLVLRLYDYAASGNCYKVRLALAQLGRAYERVPVDIFGGDTLT